MTLVSLALVGLLGCLLWWWILLPKVYFACLPITDYDLLAVPPIPFPVEETAAFVAAAPQAPAVVLYDLQTSAAITTLSNRLLGTLTRPRDHLIVFVRGHGISDDGTPFLLCSDYLRQGKSGQYPLKQLLQQISQCPASMKLLLLDFGYMNAVPRLGIVANEFPRLLDEEVKRIADPHLWVLTAAGPLEAAHVAHAARRSVFACFVAQGLCGAADRNHDGQVDLDELFDFVRSGVANWTERISNGQESQTPGLFHGGEGAVAAPPAKLALLPVTSPAKPAPAVGAAVAGSGAEGAPPAAKRQQSERKKMRQLLGDAWRLHDRGQTRSGEDGWSPIDYAPHLWREYEATLLACERHYQCGSATEMEKLTDILGTEILPLGDVLSKGSPPPSIGKAAIPSRLADARRRFLDGGSAASFGRGPRERAVKEAVQLKNDLVFRAVGYVRWHACASRASRTKLSLYDKILQLLQKLADFTRQLELLEKTPSAAGAGGVRGQLEEIGKQVPTLQELRKGIESEGLEKEADELIRNPRSNDRDDRIAAILHAALVPADQRMRLLDVLENLEQPPFESLSPTGGPLESRPLASWQWDRLAEQSQLETQLVRLAAPGAEIVLSSRSGGPGAGAAGWEAYREFGKQLRAFYEKLPLDIGRSSGTADLAQQEATERLLRASDARDAGRIGDEVFALAVRPITLPPLSENVPVKTEPRSSLPDVVDLQVEGIPEAAAEMLQGAVRLRPFPNRATSYRFAVVNRSGRTRDVTVQLLALPESSPPWRGGVPREELYDGLGNLRDGVKELTKPMKVSLPADAAPRPIAFPEPKPAAAEPPGAKPPTAAPPKPRITRGLACVIRDVATPARWIAWIDVDPCPPRHYVQGHVGFNRLQRKIAIELRASDPRTAPPLSPEHPITVRWPAEDASGLEPGRKDEAAILPEKVATLFAFVTAGIQGEVPVSLTIDGYPRALVYHVPSDQEQESIEREGTLKSIRIISPQPGAVFDVSPDAPIRTLPVVLQVDAPENAFRSSADVVQVGIEASGGRDLRREEARQFFSDRQVEVFLDEVGPQGRVVISTKVDDFHIALDPGGLKNTEVNIVAQLVLAGQVAAARSAVVVLDGMPPEFRVYAPAVHRGAAMNVAVEVTRALSGLKEVEFTLDQKAQIVRQADSNGRWSASLPTKELAAGHYVLTVRVTNRVGRSNVQKQDITIASSMPAPASAAPPALGTITGRVVLDNDDRLLANIRLSLRGTNRVVTTGSEGTFTFADLPQGKYTLDAEGPAIGRLLKGSLEIELKNATEPTAAEIRLKW
jgi:hypothetical protein